MTANIRTIPELQAALESVLAELRAHDLQADDGAKLGALAASLKSAKDYEELVAGEITRRVIINGQSLPGVTTKPEVKQRVWHDEEIAGQLAREKFGDKAFKLLTPAALEKLGAEGVALAAIAAYKPEAGKKVVY